MATFRYATKDQGLKTFEAPDANEALKISESFADRAPTSGVQRVEPTVLSSQNAKDRFDLDVQPKIDRANTMQKTALSARQEPFVLEEGETSTIDPEIQAEIDATKTAEERLYEQRLESIDRQQKQAQSIYKNLTTAANQAAQAQIAGLTGQWQERRELLIESNRANEATWRQGFIRTGQSEYSPGMTGDFLSAKEREGMRRVQQLDDQYNAAVAQVNAAVDERNFSRAADLTATLQDLENQTFEIMQKNLDEAKKVNEAFRKASRDSAVASVVAQGFTDPVQVMEMLNFNATGQQVGDFTAEEVENALKILSPDASMSGLTADYRTYKTMLNNSELPKDTSYTQFLAMITNAKRVKSSGGGSGGDGVSGGVYREIANTMSTVAGSDTYVAPEDYKFYRQLALTEDNISPQEFDKRFRVFVNPSHAWEYNLTITVPVTSRVPEGEEEGGRTL